MDDIPDPDTAHASTAGHRSRPSLVRVWNLTLVVAPALLIAVLGWRRRWLADDALIITRTVREILAGNGPVFSPGERAEASTSTLWQWLLALGSFVTRADPVRLALFAGLLLTAAGFLVAVDGTRRLFEPADAPTGGAPRLLLPAGVLVLLGMPSAWDYATSGLETGLVTFWLALDWWLLVRLRPASSRRSTAATCFLLGLGPLVRPDMLLVSVTFLVAAWLLAGRPGGRRLGIGLLCAAALPVAYEIFRMGYYGQLVPLPAVAKEAGAADWTRGGAYLRQFLGQAHLAIAVVLLAVTGAALLRALRSGGEFQRRIAVLLALPVGTGLLMTLYVTRVGGDWMRYRMLLPALFVLVLPVLVVPATRLLLPCTVVLFGWTVVAVLHRTATPIPAAAVSDARGADVRLMTMQLTGLVHPDRPEDLANAFPDFRTAVDDAVVRHQSMLFVYSDRFGDDHLYGVPLAQPGDRPVVVGSYLGAAGATAPLDVRVVDQLSLAYPLGAHQELQRGLWPGHEKLVGNSWILADYAAPGALPDAPQPPEVTPAAVDAARQALQCGDLRELQESARQPLTVGRFMHNLLGAVHRTRLRIPRDPFVAERTFCR